MSKKSKDRMRDPYRKVGKASEYSISIDDDQYILNVPEFKAFDLFGNSRKKNENQPVYEKIAEYAASEGLKLDKDHPPMPLVDPKKYIELIKRAKKELGQGWGVNEKIWIKNIAHIASAPYANVRPDHGSGFSKPRGKMTAPTKHLGTIAVEDGDSNSDNMKKSVILNEEDIVFGGPIEFGFGEKIRSEEREKKDPTMTRKEFVNDQNELKDDAYREFLSDYAGQQLALDDNKTTHDKYFVSRKKNPDAWNKIVDANPSLVRKARYFADQERQYGPDSFPATNDKGESLHELWEAGEITEAEYDRAMVDHTLLKDPEAYFNEIYWPSMADYRSRDPSEGFLSSDDDSVMSEEYEEIVEKEAAPAPVPAPTPVPAPAPAPAPAPGPVRPEISEDLHNAGWRSMLSKTHNAYYFYNKNSPNTKPVWKLPTKGGRAMRRSRKRAGHTKTRKSRRRAKNTTRRKRTSTKKRRSRKK